MSDEQELDDDFAQATGMQSTGGLPIIQWASGELPRMVDRAEQALLASRDVLLFQRGAMVVRVVREASMSARHFQRLDAGAVTIRVVDKHFLQETMTRVAVWEKLDGRSGKWLPMNCPEEVPLKYLARSGQWKLPLLLATTAAPTLRPDGTVLQEPGYDAQTATWYEPPGIEFPRVSESPTREEIDAALETLTCAIDSVPFVDGVDTSVMLAMMLTALVRRALPSAPMGAITAPTPGSGKSLLADCIGILATGVRPGVMTFPSSDEEAEKLALSLLMASKPIVLLDNIERPLEGAWLCTMLTSETYEGRMLGRNEMVSVPTSTLFLATGNRLVIRGDLRRRTLLCRIDARVENPHERKFDRDLKEIFAERRAALVHAGLTLIRGYLSDTAAHKRYTPWGSFEVWSRMCREPLLWAGLKDPCASYATLSDDDPDRQEHRALIDAWATTFGDDDATAADAITQASFETNKDFAELLKEVARDRGAGTLSARRLGIWLNAKAGRPVDGRMFERAGARRGSVCWRVVKMDG